MNKQQSIIDENFSELKLADYHLSIQIGKDELAYRVLDKDRNEVIVLESFTLQNNETFLQEEILSKLINQNKILQYKYQQVFIIFDATKATLVPVSLYEQANNADYLKLVSNLADDDLIFTDYVQSLDAMNIYSLPKKLHEVITKTFDNLVVKHCSTTLIETSILQFKNQENEVIIANVHLNYFDVLVLKGKNLLLYNTFEFKTKEDFVYYVLFIYDQLKLNPEINELLLTGEVAENSPLHAFLYKYIRFVKFGKRNEHLKFSYGFSTLPENYFYNLLNIN